MGAITRKKNVKNNAIHLAPIKRISIKKIVNIARKPADNNNKWPVISNMSLKRKLITVCLK